MPVANWIRRTVVFAAILCVSVLVVGCGKSGEKAGGSEGKGAGKGDLANGKKLFKQRCGICHTMVDAGTNGSEGPPLDTLQPEYEIVLDQIKNGGGAMPPELLTGQDAKDVATYVAAKAGK